MFNRNTTGTHNFFIRAMTEGGRTTDLPVILRICGDETVVSSRTPIVHVFKQQTTDGSIASDVFAGNFTVSPRGDPCTLEYFGVHSRNRTYGTRGRVSVKRARDRTQSLAIKRYRPIPLLTFNITTYTKGLKKGF